MGGYVLFQMSSSMRERIIANHRFYLAEATKRLLTQFENIEADAEQFASDWLAEHAKYFDPDRHDPGDFHEQAGDEMAGFYQGLQSLQSTTRLSIIAGMFHEWEKQLRDWLVSELARVIFPSRETAKSVWNAKFDEIIAFLESWNWPIRDRPYHDDLCRCHLVVNVFKHGGGTSFDKLKLAAPNLLRDEHWPDALFYRDPDYTDLRVDDECLIQFSDAIIAFWRDLPENTSQSQILEKPKWLEKGLRKDTEQRRPTDERP